MKALDRRLEALSKAVFSLTGPALQPAITVMVPLPDSGCLVHEYILGFWVPGSILTGPSALHQLELMPVAVHYYLWASEFNMPNIQDGFLLTTHVEDPLDQISAIDIYCVCPLMKNFFFLLNSWSI